MFFLNDPIVSCLLKHLTRKIKVKNVNQHFVFYKALLSHYCYDTVYSNPSLLVFYCFTFKGVPQVCLIYLLDVHEQTLFFCQEL